MSTWSNASRKQEGRFSGSWLANRLWVSLDVRPYLLLFGDTLIRLPFSFWWFISICSGPQAENSTLKVKKVGYYPTIDYQTWDVHVVYYPRGSKVGLKKIGPETAKISRNIHPSKAIRDPRVLTMVTAAQIYQRTLSHRETREPRSTGG